MNYKQLYAIKAKNEGRIKEICPLITNESGIYVFIRIDEQGIKYAYIGQAKHLLQRAAEHLSGYQHIDLSIKKHGLFDEQLNLHGWRLSTTRVPIQGLDDAEKAFITTYAHEGYQLRNKTTGGQDKGKRSIVDEGKKGYLQGKRDGYAKAYKEIGEQMSKYTQGLQSKGGAIADRKTAELLEKLSNEV